LFYRVNAFVQFPANNKEAAKTLNTGIYVQDRVAACSVIENQPVNFYCVDYWNIGNALEGIQAINKERVQQLQA
jgi:hypothetical protein